MSEKKKSAPLQAKQAVVKSAPKLPAVKSKLEYFEFDAYADAAQTMLACINAIQNHDDGKPVFFGSPVNAYRQFNAGRKVFERDELYRTRKMRRCIRNNQNQYKESEITRRVVTEKVGLLIGSFPNAGPHNPEAYMGMMIEEIIAANPSASGLEATCRELRRTKNFAPSTAEVLKELHKQEAELWGECLCIWEDDIEWWVKERERLIEAAKAKQAQEAEEKRLAEEREKERRERWERERQERLAREQREREEALRDAYRSGEIDAGRSDPKRCAEYIGREPGVLDAYLAGFTRKPIPGPEVKTNGSGQAGEAGQCSPAHPQH
jgi:hypothetical protein